MRAVVVRFLQALEVEVQVARRQVPGGMPFVDGDVLELKAVRMAATSFRLSDRVIPGKRPGNVLP